jgi:hypothetical protein
MKSSGMRSQATYFSISTRRNYESRVFRVTEAFGY